MARVSLQYMLILAGMAALLIFGSRAAVVAQDNPPGLAIAGVDSQGFPQVVVAVAVSDASGPLEDLTAENFEVLEDEIQLPAEAISVEPAQLQDLRLVLALDLSGFTTSELAQVQTAAKSLIETMAPSERVAIVTFSNEVALARKATNNTNELTAALDSLTVEGDRTAVNAALRESAALLAEEASEGRRAIIVVTNSPDNVDAGLQEQSLNQVQASDASLYMVGYGDKVQNDRLRAGVAAIGGQYLVLSEIDDLLPTFQTLAETVRTGYHLTFHSDLPADSAEHELLLRLVYQGQEVEAAGQFEAVPGTVNVTLAGLAEAETVTGPLTLTPQVESPAPLASVEYLLDEQPLATVTEPPFALEWDSSTAQAGPRILTVRATDSAGNIGETRVNFTLDTPVKVSITTLKSEIQIGEALPIQADVAVTRSLDRIEFLLDGQVQQSRTEPPYSFELDSSRYDPGSHEITVRVVDSAGQVGEDTLTLQFLPPPAPELTWFERFTNNIWVRLGYVLLLALGAIIAGVLLALLLMRLIRRIQLRRSQRLCRLEIFNAGNIAGHYRLQAQDPAGALKFQFFCDGRQLPILALPKENGAGRLRENFVPLATGSMRPVSQPLEPVGSTTGPARPVSRPASPAGESRARQAMDGAYAKQSQAQGCFYAITDILDSLGSLLPGSAGATVRRTNAQLHSGNMAIDRATRTPTQMVRTADYLRDQVAEVTPGGFKREQATEVAGSGTGRMRDSREVALERAVANGSPGGASPVASPQKAGAASAQVATDPWAQTPPVEPEHALALELLITPANPYRKERYPFTIVSKSLQEESAPAINEPGLVEIRGVSWFGRYVPRALVILLTLSLIGSVIWLTIWRLNLMDIGGYLG